METTKRKLINYWEVVNIDEDTKEITILDYVFDDKNGLKGATGSKFEPISKNEYKERISEDNIIDYIIDSGIITAPNESLLRKFAEVMYYEMSEEEKIDCAFDTSYKEKWDDVLRPHGFSEDEYPIFNCVGGGRCFDSDFKGNINTKLSKIIRKYETK